MTDKIHPDKLTLRQKLMLNLSSPMTYLYYWTVVTPALAYINFRLWLMGSKRRLHVSVEKYGQKHRLDR